MSGKFVCTEVRELRPVTKYKVLKLYRGVHVQDKDFFRVGNSEVGGFRDHFQFVGGEEDLLGSVDTLVLIRDNGPSVGFIHPVHFVEDLVLDL